MKDGKNGRNLGMVVMVLKTVSFKIDEKELERLNLWAARLGVSRSELLRRAVRKLLRELDSNNANDHKVRLYRCPVCGEVLPYLALRRHVRKHIERIDKGVKCPLCGKIFKDIVHLQHHAYRVNDFKHNALWALITNVCNNRELNVKRWQIIKKLEVNDNDPQGS